MSRTNQSSRTRSKTPDAQPHALSPLPANTRSILRTGPEAVAYHIPIIPFSPSNPILKTTISLPRYSKWTSGLHFHTRHTEFLHLLQGAIHVHLDGQDKILSAKSAGEISPATGMRKSHGAGLVIKVPRYARHEWRRADMLYHRRRKALGGGEVMVEPEDVHDEVVVEEWTEPADFGKSLFFWNLNAVVNASQHVELLSLPQRVVRKVLGGWWIPFQLFVIFWDLDNWPVFVGLRGVVGAQSSMEQLAYRYLEEPAEYAMTLIVLFAAKMLGWLVGVRAVEQRRTPDELWKAYKR
jgi:hypothetical protein